MVFSSGNGGDEGFATAVAMTVSMGLAMVVAAVTVASVNELKRTRLQFAETKTEYALGEAQSQAVLDMLHNGLDGRLRWSVDTDSGRAAVLAEPEYSKASLATAATAEDKLFEKLGVEDPEALKARLGQANSTEASQASLAGLDPSQMWRVCAPSLVSRYGQGDKVILTNSSSPDSHGFSWRPGEVWRVKTSLDGWTEDRIVRLTGNNQAPAMTIERRFIRSQGEDNQCEAVLSGGP